VAAVEARRPEREEPHVVVVETEGEAVHEVLLGHDGRVRTASRIDRDRVYGIGSPDGSRIEWRTTDSRYRLVGFRE